MGPPEKQEQRETVIGHSTMGKEGEIRVRVWVFFCWLRRTNLVFLGNWIAGFRVKVDGN